MIYFIVLLHKIMVHSKAIEDADFELHEKNILEGNSNSWTS